ncbi:exodeoxyribonuclease VII large subunit [Proteiniborus sp. DW1]|uniref:exodeoxyribonuclease VII large subunit n=1 Tax=Proteiniborus sp. DW1 TaxID=1889883 RepID=UPI00092DECDD|nr:exodeoxyribonuclease VII large subunit [Proteiniborus sp. DW1]SCG83314.1 exodeoxyribonuclease VII large subunit [Proteiniborus sp. DW1]
MELKPFKVSEITQYIKRILMGDPLLYDVGVEGEISNFKLHYNGNMYFTLKDDKSKIRCVLFNNNIDDSISILEDGMHVIVNGYISLYERDGSYQLYVRNIKRKGIGELFEAFEKLKRKLEAEGLFDTRNKKTINFIPKKIGVATSSTGAAIKDIISVVKRRMPCTEIIIYPILVQGEQAPTDICRAVKYFNTRADIDLIIIGRGGGSIEELWAFNDERVARAIYDSRLPIISAVGHETDFTIADFVADLRAPTPSAAGEIAVPQIDDLNYRLSSNLIALINIFNQSIRMKKNKLVHTYDKLLLNSPSNVLNNNRQRLDILLRDLIKAMNQSNSENKNKLNLFGNKLDSLSPLAVLKRGYSIATDKNRKVVKSIEQTYINDVLNLTLSDGSLEVRVTKNQREGR